MQKKWIVLLVLAISLIVIAGNAFSTPLNAVSSEPALAGATVSISNFQFTPKVVRIKAGGTVTWVVKEGNHTVNADDGSFESPALAAGQKFSHQFSSPGTYKYYCSFHVSKGGHDMAGT